ncbi:MAG: hypothetical protein C5B50_30565 [Verrucomicrobia bacterium]|nr:MAG: hypothetical protein C5B50_30565 [Verrucomicrobiota bacterium]
MAQNRRTHLFAILSVVHAVASAQDTHIIVHAGQPAQHLSRYLTGACIEDVNHEIYGGLYSQMIFGESFQEPPATPVLKGWTAYGGRWVPKAEVLYADAGDGPKLIWQEPVIPDEIGVEVLLPAGKGGNAGLILKVSDASKGADTFVAYEISLDSSGQLVLGRHRHNWEPLRNVPCPVPTDKWIPLTVRLKNNSLEVLVNGSSVLSYTDTEHPLTGEHLGLRTWQRPAQFRGLYIKAKGAVKRLPFQLSEIEPPGEVSGMWRGFRHGSVEGEFAIETNSPFIGQQSQRLAFKSGEGEIGLENQGLNRCGMNFVRGKPYEGCLWARAEHPATAYVRLESADGTQRYAQSSLQVKSREWQRLDFKLVPYSARDSVPVIGLLQPGEAPSLFPGRFAIALNQPGSICIGYAFLQPGEWGRFKGLPDRRDVAEALVAQGITVLRYGGSMVNDPEYRWKKMIGPRDHRPPYHGTWYPFSSNGWGIFDFLNFCEAAVFLGIPAVNIGESPQDMADFIEYANGHRSSRGKEARRKEDRGQRTEDRDQRSGVSGQWSVVSGPSDWASRRAADGHPKPYGLRYVELGNEEAINEDYWRKFKPMAEAIWAKDPNIVLVVGDFAYDKAFTDPYNFSGAPLIKSLATHKKILDLAREHNREVWFDVHIGTEEPPAPYGLPGVHSFIEQLGKLSPGAKFKVAIFEFNANNHALKRALANASAICQIENLGDPIEARTALSAPIQIACSANCLQPYKQNDNGWNQGLLFLSPSQVWPQPPYFVTQMVSRNYLPLRVETEISRAGVPPAPRSPEPLIFAATRSESAKTLVLQAANTSNDPISTTITLEDFPLRKPRVHETVLSGTWNDINTPEQPAHIKPAETKWRCNLDQEPLTHTFPPRSFSILRFE